MTAQPVEQKSLFELPTPSNYDGLQLPVMPYAGRVPAAPTDTSRAAAAAIESKLGSWQRKVLRALYEWGPLSDEALERVLHCETTRTSRPRRRELELTGFVCDSGDRVMGTSGTQVILWALTPKGEQAAREVNP